MKRTCVFVLLLLSAAARADLMPAAPIAERVARTNLVVLGKITAVDEKGVEQEAYPGAGEKQRYRVAEIEVKEALTGPKGPKTVKLAFVPQTGKRRFPDLDFRAGQEAI